MRAAIKKVNRTYLIKQKCFNCKEFLLFKHLCSVQSTFLLIEAKIFLLQFGFSVIVNCDPFSGAPSIINENFF